VEMEVEDHQGQQIQEVVVSSWVVVVVQQVGVVVGNHLETVVQEDQVVPASWVVVASSLVGVVQYLVLENLEGREVMVDEEEQLNLQEVHQVVVVAVKVVEEAVECLMEMLQVVVQVEEEVVAYLLELEEVEASYRLI